ncbi:hypothetical protein FocTR4_00010677 [Fusarium oxysporum f. sp. cubense]|uniref:Uncharacterized protein n=1 Tax=Fusarium oxysporum f. sp. cubense TaxID=61366 RepID=A0A5C6T6R2_FUSOC|nr:hypothetical protein FocTR4_00010677 [Fusarium oxysporum f. sp. cubense]
MRFNLEFYHISNDGGSPSQATKRTINTEQMDIPQSLAAGVTDELTRFPTIGLGSSTSVLWQVSKWWEHMTSHGGIGLSWLINIRRSGGRPHSEGLPMRAALECERTIGSREGASESGGWSQEAHEALGDSVPNAGDRRNIVGGAKDIGLCDGEDQCHSLTARAVNIEASFTHLPSQVTEKG